MRDLLNIIDSLNEGSTLAPGEFKDRPERWKTFIAKIENLQPFLTVDGNQVTIKKSEAKRFTDLKNKDQFKGSISAEVIGGEPILLSKLAKTAEFGGQAAVGGEVGKEALLLKPKQIGITDKDIPASDFYEQLTKNSVLKSTDYGRAVIDLATYIVSDEVVMLPEEYQKNDKVRKAIVDYAGEYLGVLALLYRRSRFPRRAQFEQWLGGSIDELILRFPSKSNENLADSFAQITNAATAHSVNISSKGTGGGAAPAISGLKVPDKVRSNPAFKNEVEFIDICQKPSAKGEVPSTIQQAFDAMDLIYKANKNALPKEWHKFLPFAEKEPNLSKLAYDSYRTSGSKNRVILPNKYYWMFGNVSGGGSEGGKLVYNIKKTVQNAINNGNALPEFQPAILQTLQMNFIQQYTLYSAGQLTFATQWPAEIEGKISVENKSTTNDPRSGGFSFKLGMVDDSSPELGDPSAAGDVEIPEPNSKASKEKVSDIFKQATGSDDEDTEGAGRKKRR